MISDVEHPFMCLLAIHISFEKHHCLHHHHQQAKQKQKTGIMGPGYSVLEGNIMENTMQFNIKFKKQVLWAQDIQCWKGMSVSHPCWGERLFKK